MPDNEIDGRRGYECLRYDEPREHVARVTLHRPERANALSARLLGELRDVVTRIMDDRDVRVWILTGAPRSDGRPMFSSGVDMVDATGRPEDFDKADGRGLVDLVDDAPKPSIAAIDGTCTTGALELALACDLRIASSRSQLSDWHMKRSGLGIGSWGSAARLSRLVGLDRAKEILLTSRVVEGEEAARIGLVHRAVEHEELMEAALETAGQIAAMPPRGVQATLSYLQLQANLSTQESIHLGTFAPELMGIRRRPFSDAASRFLRERADD